MCNRLLRENYRDTNLFKIEYVKESNGWNLSWFYWVRKTERIRIKNFINISRIIEFYLKIHCYIKI